jgi:hypothetical protein
MSPRSEGRDAGPFVPINCAAIAEEIIESELFGHVKGAFTGAASGREGLFYYARGGTLFLDEISELPPPVQAKLLRVLEERKVRPVGSEQEVPVDVRVVAATNRDLVTEVAAGRFRSDLYYRLQVVEVRMPPLRDRLEDLPDLVDYFNGQIAARLGLPELPHDDAALARLARYPWPGNVRELKNLIERSLILGFYADDFSPDDENIAGSPAPTFATAQATHPRRQRRGIAGRHRASPHPRRARPMQGQQVRGGAPARRLAQDPGAQVRRLGRLAPGGLAARFRGSLRFKLLALALGPLLLAVPILVGILVAWGAVYYDRLLITKVQSDLAVAHGYFDQVKHGVGRRVETLAGSERLARTLRERPAAAALAERLREMRQQLGLDFLILLDSNGRVRAASDGPAIGTEYAGWEVARRALSGHAETEVDILDAGQLAAIDPQLAERARTPLIPTRNAQPTQRSEETRGMLMHAAAPLAPAGRETGASAGVLVGGLLLNKNLDIVDRINEIVYPEGSLPLGSVGTATLFLDDVRIATNVRLFEGVRAIGTRVSASGARRRAGPRTHLAGSRLRGQ